MMRTLRRWLPLAAVAAAAIAAGVLLATRPWSGEEAVQETAATPAEYGLCNVSVSNIPPGVEVSAFVSPIAGPEGSPGEPGKSGELIFLRIIVPLPPGQRVTPYPEMGKDKPVQSNAVINAQTGEIFGEGYLTPSDEAKIKAVLATLRVGPWEPAGPAWPRTDTLPRSDIVELDRPWELPPDYREPTLKYRMPERGSGMMVERTTASPGMREPLLLRAYTCESIVEVFGATGKIVRKEVTPEEEAVFQRFLDEVVPPTGARATGERGPS